MDVDQRRKQWELYNKNRIFSVRLKVGSQELNNTDDTNSSEVTRRLLRPLPQQPPKRTGCCGRG